MKKRIAALLRAVPLALAITMVLALAGCDEGSPIQRMLGLGSGNSGYAGGYGEEGGSSEEGVTPPKAADADTAYYNGYTGLSLVVPEGYYVSEMDHTAMTEEPEASADRDAFSWNEYQRGYYSITLFDISNMGRSDHEDQAIMQGYLDYYIEYSLEDYLGDLEYNITYENEYYWYDIVEKEEIDFHGKPAWYLEVKGGYKDDEEELFTQMFVVIEVEKDTFLYFYADCWNDSRASQAAAEKMLWDCLDFV